MVKTLKRVIALVIVISTVALFAVCPKAEGTEIIVTAFFDKTSYAQGETAYLTLNLSGVSVCPVSAFDFSVGFKSKALSVANTEKIVTSYSVGQSITAPQYLSVTAPKANKIHILYLDESADQSVPINMDGAFCTIAFTVLQDAPLGTHTLMLDNDGSFSDTNMTLCKVKMQDSQYIIQKNIAGCTFGKIKNRAFAGKGICPKVTVSDNGTTLVKDKDYSVSYANNINVGNAVITVTGIGEYSGSKNISFKINQKDIAKCTTPKIPNQFWTGKRVKPQVPVLIGTVATVRGVDYKVSFKKNKKIGTATATVKGVGNLKGSVSATFKILPNKVTLKSAVSKKSGRATIKFKKSRGAQGYQIQYSHKSKLKKVKAVGLGKKQTVALSKLKSGKKLYFRLRSYRKVGNKYYYSPYSPQKSIDIV